MTDPVRIERPCDRAWSSLSGDGVRRSCDDCDTHVLDLHALTDEEIAEKRAAGGFCGAYVADADGAFRRPAGTGRSSIAAAAAAVLALVGACGRAGEPSTADPGEASGEPTAGHGAATEPSGTCPDCGVHHDHGSGSARVDADAEAVIITGYLR